MEVIETNDAGEKRITRGCYYEIMMRWMGDVVKASMGAAAASNDTRNKVLGGLLGLAEHMQSAKLQGPAITINAIEGPTDGAETQSSN